jgi:hypothetical protein
MFNLIVSATAVSPDICDIAKQVMTGTAMVEDETKLRLINSRIPEDDFKFPAIESIETCTTSMKSNDAVLLPRLAPFA